MAMASGLTCTPPAPIVSAASCASSAGAGIDPANDDSGSDQAVPRPNWAAILDMLPGLSRRECPANAVLQPCAKSALNSGSSPSPCAGGSLLNVSPPTSLTVVHGTGASIDSPLPSSAAV